MEMADIVSLLDVELMVLVVILYFVGEGIKMMQIDNKFIPVILPIIGIALATLYYVALGDLTVTQYAFNGITQGILAAGLSVFANQVYKQVLSPDDDDSETL